MRYRTEYCFDDEWIKARPAGPKEGQDEVFFSTSRNYWFPNKTTARKFCAAMLVRARQMWPDKFIAVRDFSEKEDEALNGGKV